MIQPYELSLPLQVEVADGVRTTTSALWDILVASRDGDLQKVKGLVKECPALIYGQYNYTPPIHFAVREGHTELVEYLLDNGAHDPMYKTYPFGDSLQTIAEERGYFEIKNLLDQYATNNSIKKFTGDNGKIFYNRSVEQQNFQTAVSREDLEETARILKVHPEYALDKTYFWSEGILTFAAKKNNRPMIDLLMQYGAKVPNILKWTPAYYFERYDGACYMMENGMDPNTMSWHGVTVLHNMAQTGDIKKAALLIGHGADINLVEEEYQSTALGLASRWGHTEMVNYLLSKGADATLSGAAWSTPLAWAKTKGYDEIVAIIEKMTSL